MKSETFQYLQSTRDCCLIYFKVLILISWGGLGLFLAALIGPYPVLRYCTKDIPRLICGWCSEGPV